jgi:septal ring factor EnvC (AmiA/AmiB activator)
MPYIPVKEASKLAGVHSKTIKRAVRDKQIKSKRDGKGKTAPILVELEEVKERWGVSQESTKQSTKQEFPEVSTSDENIKEALQALQSTIKTLEKQLGEKDKQLERLDGKLDQQQQLTAGLQKQIYMLQAPHDGEVVQDGKEGKAGKAPKQKDKGKDKERGIFRKIFRR